jgi:hypothetical protein
MKWVVLNVTFKAFKKQGLLKAGIIIDFGDEKLLVGHINQLGGHCDDCPVDAGRVVKAYAKVIDIDEILRA